MTASHSEVRPLHLRRGGRDIEGRWSVANDEVHVECAFGSDHARCDGAPPARVAELLIARLAFSAMGGRRLEPAMI